MNNKEIQQFYHPELDGLRFVAFLLVFIHHAPFIATSKLWTTLHEYGWIGVDIFLCLSSFLITKLLIREFQDTKAINFKYFYIRRILKIWPLYFAFVFFTTIYSYVNQLSGFSWLRVFGMVTFTDNIMAVISGKYNHFFAFVHLWTISFEEQFYFIAPFLTIFLINKIDKIKLVYLLSAIFIGNIIRAIFLILKIEHPAIWVFPLTHFESILFGIFLAFFHLSSNKPQRTNYWVVFIVGIICLITTTRFPNLESGDWSLMLTYPLIGIGSGLIISAVLNGNIKMITNVLMHKTVSYLGKISYGLYVFHILGLTLADYFYKTFSTSNNLNFYVIIVGMFGLIFNILLSIASYNLLEMPFLKLKDDFSLIKSRPI